MKSLIIQFVMDLMQMQIDSVLFIIDSAIFCDWNEIPQQLYNGLHKKLFQFELMDLKSWHSLQ